MFSLCNSLEITERTNLALCELISFLGVMITRSISDQGRHNLVACDPYTFTSLLGIAFLITAAMFLISCSFIGCISCKISLTDSLKSNTSSWSLCQWSFVSYNEIWEDSNRSIIRIRRLGLFYLSLKADGAPYPGYPI